MSRLKVGELKAYLHWLSDDIEVEVDVREHKSGMHLIDADVSLHELDEPRMKPRLLLVVGATSDV